MRNLPPSSDDESSDEDIMALDTTLLFCLELRPSSTSPPDFLEAPFLPPLPSLRPFFSLARPRSSPPLAFFRDLLSVWRGFRSALRFFDGGPAPSSPLRMRSLPSVTKPSPSSFFLRP